MYFKNMLFVFFVADINSWGRRLNCIVASNYKMYTWQWVSSYRICENIAFYTMLIHNVHCDIYVLTISILLTTQMKFNISCSYFFVLSTLNVCRLWKDLQVKLKFSEDISYITTSIFCEKHFIPNDLNFNCSKTTILPPTTKTTPKRC